MEILTFDELVVGKKYAVFQESDFFSWKFISRGVGTCKKVLKTKVKFTFRDKIIFNKVNVVDYNKTESGIYLVEDLKLAETYEIFLDTYYKLKLVLWDKEQIRIPNPKEFERRHWESVSDIFWKFNELCMYPPKFELED